MKTHKVTIELSETDYNLLKEMADASKWPLQEVIMQCIQAGMPPSLSKVPEAFHADLIVLNSMNDKELMQVADGRWPEPANQTELHRKADFASLRRTYALSLLKWRGHPIIAEDVLL
ncbi:MAG: hypothetical protein KF770_19775 [Anaerolineae bacterium]|nr:hypothetical protein [Anaerolineae bacterium]